VNICIFFRAHAALRTTVAVLLFLVTLRCSLASDWQKQESSQAQQQASEPQKNPQPPAPPPDPPVPKPRKIWTNDDMPSLRTPADTYLAEKEARDAAAAEAVTKKAELEKQTKRAVLTIDLPPTSEETQRLIKSKQDRIQELKNRLELLAQDSPDIPEKQKAANQKQIEEFTGESQALQLEVKVLQDHLQSLAKTPPIDQSPVPSTSEPPRNLPPL
jgi:hypothetical protein